MLWVWSGEPESESESEMKTEMVWDPGIPASQRINAATQRHSFTEVSGVHVRSQSSHPATQKPDCFADETTSFGLPLLLPANRDTGHLGNDEQVYWPITNSLHAHPSLVCIKDIDCKLLLFRSVAAHGRAGLS